MVPPSAPRSSVDVIEILLVTTGGQELGAVKVLRDARMSDVFDDLMSFVGGHNGYNYQPVLVFGAGVFDEADQCPFLFADDDDAFILIKVPLRDNGFLHGIVALSIG